MRRSSSIRLAAVPLLLLGGLVPALAQSTATSSMSGLKLNGDQPIQIESNKLEVHQNDNLAIFSGDVSVVQGPTLLKAGKMTVYYVKGDGSANDKSSTMTGSANIDHLEVDEKVYIKSDDQVATGDSGTFDMKSQILVLSGKKVVLSQGKNVLQGCKLTVQMDTGLAQVEGCGGRVMMSITPESQKP